MALAAALARLAARRLAAASAVQPLRRPARRAPALPQPEDRPAADLYVADAPATAHVRLRATSDVRSRGRGPMELRGHRATAPLDAGPTSGSTRPAAGTSRFRPGRRCTSPTSAPTSAAATGRSTSSPGSSSGRSTAAAGSLRRVRVGPKLNYCLRDLERTRPGPPLAQLPRTTPAATRTPTRTRSRSAPRSAGRTSTPPTTTSSGSTSAGCAAASPS